MSRKILALCALGFLASAAMAADSPTITGQINGIEIGKPTAPPAAGDEQQAPSRSTCLTHCDSSESRCSGEVRRARQQCSRNASTAGREPFTGRQSSREQGGRYYDFSYFCTYFDRPGRNCGSDIYSRDCQARFVHRYGVCVETLNENIASMRHDCQRTERDAQKFCRDELRDCKAACQ